MKKSPVSLSAIPRVSAGIIGLCYYFCSIVMMSAAPIVQYSDVHPEDAPLIKVKWLGYAGHDAKLSWNIVGPGKKKGSAAIYLFIDPAYGRRDKDKRFEGLMNTGTKEIRKKRSTDGTPFMIRVDLTDKSVKEYFLGDDVPGDKEARASLMHSEKLQLNSDETEDNDLLPESRDNSKLTRHRNWIWQRPIKAVPTPEGYLLLKTTANEIIEYRPNEDTFIFINNQGKLPVPPPEIQQRYNSIKTKFDFGHEPPQVSFRQNGKWQTVNIHYSRAARDGIKFVKASPDGKFLYAAGWPVAYLSRMNLQTGEIRRLGQDYVWYKMLFHNGWLYGIGYYGVKLMRWHPDKPFDPYGNRQHDYRKNPWGPRDSNPQLIVMFRFVHNLGVRRPSGLALGADGRFYTGAHDTSYTASINDGVKGLGGFCWYDPTTDSCASIPLQNFTVITLCRVGKYIAVGGGTGNFLFAPPPAKRGINLLLYDTEHHKFAKKLQLPASGIFHVNEATPGLLVCLGGAGKYSDGKTGGLICIYDTNNMRLTRVIKVPFHFAYNSHNMVNRSRTCPDKRVYFYAIEHGKTALFRVDANTGKVEAIARGKEISKGVLLPGAPFEIVGDYVYFAGGDSFYRAAAKDILQKPNN